MRHFMIIGGALAALTTSAFAADMPAYAPEPAVAPAYDWSGFYIGAHGGWAFGDTDDDDFFHEEYNGTSWDRVKNGFDDIEGFVVGGQIGYNWQWDRILLGFEGDASFVDQDRDSIFEEFGFGLNFLASARGRIGLAFDRLLLYGTGGAAFAGVDFEGFDDDNTDFFGWVAGGGIEYAFTDNVTFGVEFLHYEFGDEPIGNDDLGVDVFDMGLSEDVIRGRLNVKFNGLFGG